MSYLDWLLPWREVGETETMELRKITWTEEVERDYDMVTERFVWGGGAEKTVTHIEDRYVHHHTLIGVDGDIVLEIEERPAYREELECETVTQTETARRSAWVSGDIPEGAEETDVTKTVVVSG